MRKSSIKYAQYITTNGKILKFWETEYFRGSIVAKNILTSNFTRKKHICAAGILWVLCYMFHLTK